MTKQTFGRARLSRVIEVFCDADTATIDDIGDSEAVALGRYEYSVGNDEETWAVLWCEVWAWRDESGAFRYEFSEDEGPGWLDIDGRELDAATYKALEFMAGGMWEFSALLQRARGRLMRAGYLDSLESALVEFERKRAEDE